MWGCLDGNPIFLRIFSSMKVILFECASYHNIFDQYGYEHNQEIPFEDMFSIVEKFVRDGWYIKLMPYDEGYIIAVDKKVFTKK